MHVDVQLEDGQAAERGKRRKAVIRDISDVDRSLRRNELECTYLVHWTGALHRFSSRDAIIFVGSVLEKHFSLTMILPQIKKKRLLSNVGHRGTKAENLAWHPTG